MMFHSSSTLTLFFAKVATTTAATSSPPNIASSCPHIPTPSLPRASPSMANFLPSVALEKFSKSGTYWLSPARRRQKNRP